MKNQKSKKVLSIVAVLAIVAAIVIGGILAYLTDTTEVVQNKFTIGDVEITLTEPEWSALTDSDTDGIPDAAEAITAGKNITKDPTVNNVGNNPAYVYVKVEVPHVNLDASNAADLFTYSVNDGWTKLGEKVSTTAGTDSVYVYYYNTALAAGATTTAPVFSSVTVANITSEGVGSTDGTVNQQIDVTAYAIQSDGVTSVTNNEMATSLQSQLQ